MSKKDDEQMGREFRQTSMLQRMAENSIKSRNKAVVLFITLFVLIGLTGLIAYLLGLF